MTDLDAIEARIAKLHRAHIMGASREDSVSTYSEARDDLSVLVAAIRAVLEIHKPVINGGADTDYGYKDFWVCVSEDHAGVASRDWPCATVRALGVES